MSPLEKLERLERVLNWNPGKPATEPPLETQKVCQPDDENEKKELLNQLDRIFHRNVTKAQFSNGNLRDLLAVGELIDPFMKIPFSNERTSRSGQEILQQALAKGHETVKVDLSDCTDISDEDIELLTEKCPHLKVLNLSRMKSLTLKGIEALGKFNQLIYLNLEACLYYPPDYHEIMRESYRLKKSEESRRAYSKNIPKLTDEILRKLTPNWPHLKFMGLAGHVLIDVDGLEELGKRCKHLIGLDIRQLLVGDMTWIALNLFKELRMLNLAGCTAIEEGDLEYLAKKHPRMVSLILDRSSVPDNELRPIRELENLTSLTLE